MKIIEKKVLIKEAQPGHADKVFVVKNLPTSLIFDDQGKLQDGIVRSQTKDGALLFENWSRQGKERLEIIDRYIDSVWPRTKVLPKRIANQQVEGLMTSPALTMTELEERTKSLYGVPFLDLPIPDEKDIPTFENIQTAEVVSKTYRNEEFLDVDQKPKEVVSRKPIEIPQLKCEGCDFIGKSKQSLLVHIRKKHKEQVKEVATISNP